MHTNPLSPPHAATHHHTQVLVEFYGTLDDRRKSVITTDKMALAHGAVDCVVARMTFSLVHLVAAATAALASVLLTLLLPLQMFFAGLCVASPSDSL